MVSLQRFGGDWTEEKLERVRKYLVAYATIMNKHKFSFAYIDAFAGTGYRTLKQSLSPSQNELMFPELMEVETQQFMDGSARIALQVQPAFEKFIFIEKDENRFIELQKLEKEFPTLVNKIILVNDEANKYIKETLCQKDWGRHRAVLFLDPFGMAVQWSTIEAIAKTQAIDLWIFFPLGIAVNRLLKKDH